MTKIELSEFLFKTYVEVNALSNMLDFLSRLDYKDGDITSLERVFYLLHNCSGTLGLKVSDFYEKVAKNGYVVQ